MSAFSLGRRSASAREDDRLGLQVGHGLPCEQPCRCVRALIARSCVRRFVVACRAHL